MADSEVPAGSIERRAEALESPSRLVAFWLAQLRTAEKQERAWRDEADAAVKRYRGDSGKTEAFNILHANVSTIVPAVYNSAPIPDVRPRLEPPAPAQPSNDPAALQQALQAQMIAQAAEIARKGAQVVEKALSFSIDQYDFDATLVAAVRDNNVAGRGVTRVRWHTYMRQDQDAGEQLQWEEVACEQVPWRLFRRGPGSNWGEVPWVAFGEYYDLDALDRLTGSPEIANAVPRDVTDVSVDPDATRSGKELDAFKKALVWSIWDRASRQNIFICEGYTAAPLRVEPDPYGIRDFFPMPHPLQAIADPDTMTPIVPYTIYQRQAEELSRVSERILKLIEILKYRGIAAAELPELLGVKDLEDGEFKTSETALTLLTGGQVNSLDAAIWTAPIDKIVAVVRELVLQRNEIKQAIYEITGIADIMRGVTAASETLGAQQIKASWGSLRIQDQQREVQRYCRDIFRLKAEIIGNKFSPETLSIMVGEPVTPELMQVLRNDVRRGYLIDIETDSTIRADLTRSQQQMAEFLSGTAQYWSAFVPLIASGQMPPAVAQAAVTVYAAFSRQFRLGKQVEDALAQLEQSAQQMPPPVAPPGPQAPPAPDPRLQEAEVARAAENVRRAAGQADEAEARARVAAMPPRPRAVQ